MAYRKRQTLTPSIVTVLETMAPKVWVTPDRKVFHNGDDDLRDEIAANIERGREIGATRSALFFLAVLLTAMDRGTFTPVDIKTLDHMGQGNAQYLLEKLKEIESD
ncbi:MULTISPECIES: hypothetical protein [unclassified Streptomyces]|nr:MULTISPECIES: hypothetical protein [unclassified Streptomyces]NMI58426.1 hypothetical protein [Streptomyces sp. RLA2-12]QDO50277.1 hypothetical protein FNV60_20125 [Streptomyces sp. RLB3-5]QDO60517.1 hypothetical protein FNV59_22365 [Streptomyces sp. RLB1-8]